MRRSFKMAINNNKSAPARKTGQKISTCTEYYDVKAKVT